MLYLVVSKFLRICQHCYVVVAWVVVWSRMLHNPIIAARRKVKKGKKPTKLQVEHVNYVSHHCKKTGDICTDGAKKPAAKAVVKAKVKVTKQAAKKATKKAAKPAKKTPSQKATQK